MIFNTLRKKSNHVLLPQAITIIFEVVIAILLCCIYVSYASFIYPFTGVWGSIFLIVLSYIFLLTCSLLLGNILYFYYYHWKPVKIPVRISSTDDYANPRENGSTPSNIGKKFLIYVGPYVSGLLVKFPFVEKIVLILTTPQEYIHQMREKKFMEANSAFRADMPHNGIVICHGNRNSLPFYGSGADQLLHYFLERHIPYQLYNCFTFDDFVSVVQNDAVQVMWIFGHGNRGGVGLKDGCLSYRDNIPCVKRHKKISVYQLHCNGGTAIPLSQLVVDGWDFREEGLTLGYKTRAHIKQILADPDKFPGIWKSVGDKSE